MFRPLRLAKTLQFPPPARRAERRCLGPALAGLGGAPLRPQSTEAPWRDPAVKHPPSSPPAPPPSPPPPPFIPTCTPRFWALADPSVFPLAADPAACPPLPLTVL